MEPSLFRYILHHSWRDQVKLLVLTALSFPFLYASLELPKVIINDAIGAERFPVTHFGFEFDQIPFLLTLCGLYLALVFCNGAFKYVVNVFKGQLGERMLRRLRYELYSRVLRFPLPHFRKASPGELIAMITSEVEALGGFIGDAFAQPAFQGGTLLTILFFMFVQDWVLGVAAVALYPVQMILIPKLQRRVNALAKQRVQTVRRLSERIGETVGGIHEVHANDAAERERADFSRWVGTIYGIRYRIYRLKFFIKFLNNFIAQLTPFFFFSIGGYLVIMEELSFGALVAVLAAYKDLSAPWKELLTYYQQKEDSKVKYEQIVDQFDPPGMLDAALQEATPASVPPIEGRIEAVNVGLEDGAVKILDGVSFGFDLGQRVAIVGTGGSGRGEVAEMLARLVQPTAGVVSVGGTSLGAIPESVTGRRIAYVGPSAYVFLGSVRDNLLYGLRHFPLRGSDDPERQSAHEAFAAEARKAGNTTSDLDADWTDYAAAGADGPESLGARIAEVLGLADFEEDVLGFGLKGAIDPETSPDLAARFLDARAVVRTRLQEPKYRGLVEPFDRDRYNANMSVAENVLFGTPVGREFDLGGIGENAYMLGVLAEVGLIDDFLAIGARVAEIMLDLFRDLPPGHEFFERFSFISAEALPQYESVVRRADAGGLAALVGADRSLLMSLPFKLVVERHRLGVVDEALQARLLAARAAFARGLPAELSGAVAFFDVERYNAQASVQDNILFGRLAYGRQQSQGQVSALIAEVVDALDLRRSIVDVGLDHAVGIAGSRLSLQQRQKLGLARALMKRPDLLVINQATAALDPHSQDAIMASLLSDAGPPSQVWVMADEAAADRFDYVVAMEGGRVAEHGPARASHEGEPPAAEHASGRGATGE